MAQTTSRILQLLNLLQTHRQWSGAQLADRLAVTRRTLRRDIDRLRELGYRVEATRGSGGGYRLEAGAELPPLLLTAEEAVTMAIGLRVAAAEGLTDGEQTTLSALAKFEQVLPSALRQRVNALAAAVQASSTDSRRTPVPPDLLGQLALCAATGSVCGFTTLRATAPRRTAWSNRTRWSPPTEPGFSSAGTFSASTGARSASTE
jgi:biotin operon repressor BirA-like protein